MTPAPSRRQFLAASAAIAASGGLRPPLAQAAPSAGSPAETAAAALFRSLSPKQRETVAFAWDHKDKRRGLLRTHVSNNWQITEPKVRSDFYTKDQQALVRSAFDALINPAWKERFDQQLSDDNDGEPWGTHQSVALFGEPGTDRFEFVLTGRHQTIRADGNTAGHVAFGGPIFYGHAAEGFYEKADHPENVFWPQAKAANALFASLSGRQQAQAQAPKSPSESAVGFRGAKSGEAPGLPVAELAADQQREMQKVLALLLEPFRADDQSEALACLKAQGGLGACRLAFFTDKDVGADRVWDNWRLEGPAFVWHFRGHPHVHVWVNVADSPDVATNAAG